MRSSTLSRRSGSAAHQGYGIRDYATDNYTQPAPYFDSDASQWEKFNKGRTLLMIHGTFSRASGAFNGLPLDSMKALQAMYEDRVIAFDHQSISRDPTENIAWLLDTIPDGLTLDFDIVCHSRGGLVARSLTERTDAMPGPRKIKVHRTALVGTVNNGTILADVKHWNDLIDVLSTVLNTVGVVVGDTVDLVLSFVRQIAVAAYPHLRGLSCMVPGGQFLKKLNGQPRGDNEYLAIASDYEPTDSHVASFFRDMVTDGLFSEKPERQHGPHRQRRRHGRGRRVRQGHRPVPARRDEGRPALGLLREQGRRGQARQLAAGGPPALALTWNRHEFGISPARLAVSSRLRRGGGPPTMPVLVLFTYGARPGSLR